MVNYIAQILIFVSIFAILAGSLNLIMGYAGVVSVFHAAFFGIGAYTAARLVLLTGIPFPFDLPASFALSALTGLAVAWLLTRLNEEYVIIGTLALQLVASTVFLNWESVTGGSKGIFGVPWPSIAGFEITSLLGFAVVSATVAALCLLLLWRAIHSPFGLALKGTREDRALAQSLGKNVNRQLATAFGLGSGVAGIAGAMYARFLGYIEPSSFDINQSLAIITMVVVGGLGNLWGAVISAGVLETVPQVLRFFPATSRIVPHLQLLIFGFLLIVLVRWRPQGLLRERALVRRRDFQDIPTPDGESSPVERAAPVNLAGMAPSASLSPRWESQAYPLDIQGLTKAFGGLKAVDELSMRIEVGKVTAILGPNGAGKTTVFNLLTGYLRADSGKIYYGHKEISRMRPFEISRLGIARSFQDVRIFPAMTALENMVLSTQSDDAEYLRHVFSPRRKAHGRRGRERALSLLEDFGLANHADRRAADLSYAEQKLLVIAILSARGAPLVLLDELAAGLDHDSVNAFAGLVRQIAASGRTVCLIEHNLEFVWQTADEVVVLAEGGLVARGTPQEIQNSREVAEIYFGSKDVGGIGARDS